LSFSYWETLEGSPFLPRIRYKNIALCPAQWCVNFPQLRLQEDAPVEKIMKRLEKWLSVMEVDQMIYLVEDDNHILLDISNKDHLALIISQLKNHSTVKLIEHPGGKAPKNWLRTTKGFHLSELVIPFLFKGEKKKSSIHQPPFAAVSNDLRFRPIGSEWCYCKVYLPAEEQDRFLLTHLAPFAEDLKTRKIVLQWFYIRYRDEKDHLRVRFKLADPKTFSDLVTALGYWSSSALEGSVITDFLLGTYEREVERYGGEGIIDVAENYFCAESLSSLNLLHDSVKNMPYPKHILASVILADLMSRFSSAIGPHYFDATSLNYEKKYLRGIRKWKTDLRKLLDEIKKDDHEVESLIRDAISTRNEAFENYCKAILDAVKKGTLSSSPQSILHSIFHMLCNRLIGIDPEKEKQAYAYACYLCNHYNPPSPDIS